jgi:hypothetical protein
MARFEEQVHHTGERAMLFECPGCECLHVIRVSGAGHPCWTFNGNLDKPTVSPSILVTSTWKGVPTVCHSFINDGRIQFLGDCTHALAGQTVDLPEVES